LYNEIEALDVFNSPNFFFLDQRYPSQIMSISEIEADPSAFRPFTKAERIQQLNDIDKVSISCSKELQFAKNLQSITQLLQSAGLALKTLSASQSSDPPPADRRKAFEAASNAYLETLQKVDVGLRRQIWGLEEADIIPAEKAKKVKDIQESGAMNIGKSVSMSEGASSSDTGMGKLDIGWLNSRSGRVGRDMEAELWERAKGFLEQLEEGKTSGTAKDGEDDVMGT
jgi:hypothetical protein